MDTVTQKDPKPFINPATMERAAEATPGAFWDYAPRRSWPQMGGRMVRRDYLRPGDRAVSSHYGPRTVKSVHLGGTEGQTTGITWETPSVAKSPFTEIYDSHLLIELLPAEPSPAVEDQGASDVPETLQGELIEAGSWSPS